MDISGKVSLPAGGRESNKFQEMESLMQQENLGKMPSMIQQDVAGDISSFFDNSKSFVF